MAVTTSPADTQIILVDDVNLSDSMLKIERIEHIGSEVSFFLESRDERGEATYLSIHPETAKALHAWLGKHLGE